MKKSKGPSHLPVPKGSRLSPAVAKALHKTKASHAWSAEDIPRKVQLSVTGSVELMPRRAMSPGSYQATKVGIRYITVDLIKKICKESNLDLIASLNLTLSKDSGKKIKYIENLDQLKYLQSLNLSCNVIEKIEKLEKLMYLQELNLSFNCIGKIEGLELLTRLQVLNLTGNQIEHIPPWIGKKLKALQVFKIAKNNLSLLSEVTRLKSLSDIMQVSVTDNPMAELPHSRLYVIFHIRTLEILDGQPVSAQDRQKAKDRFSQEEVEKLEKQLEQDKVKYQTLASEHDKSLNEIEQWENSDQQMKNREKMANEKIKELEHELDTKNDLLKKKTVELNKACEKHYQLEQELGFYKIDAKFASLGKGPECQPVLDSDDNEPFLESPYIGRARYKPNCYAHEHFIEAKPQLAKMYSTGEDGYVDETDFRENQKQLQDELDSQLEEKNIEIERAENHLKELKNELETTENNVKRAREELNKMSDVILCQSPVDEGRMKIRQGLANKMKIVNQLRGQATQIEKEIEKIQNIICQGKGDVLRLKEQLKQLDIRDPEYRHIYGEMVDKEQHISESIELHEQLHQQLEELVNSIATQTDGIKELEQELSEGQLQQNEELREELGSVVSGLQGYLENVKAQNHKQMKHIEQLLNEKDALQDKVKSLEDELNMSNRHMDLEDANKRLTEAENSLQQYQELNSSLENQLYLNQQETKDAQERLQKAAMRISDLEQLLKETEGKTQAEIQFLEEQLVAEKEESWKILQNLREDPDMNKSIQKLAEELQEFKTLNSSLQKELQKKQHKFQRVLNDSISPGELKKRLKNLSQCVKLRKDAIKPQDENDFVGKIFQDLQQHLMDKINRMKRDLEQTKKEKGKSDAEMQTLVEKLQKAENKFTKLQKDNYQKIDNQEKSRDSEVKKLENDVKRLQSALRDAQNQVRQRSKKATSIVYAPDETDKNSLNSEEKRLFDELQRELMDLKRRMISKEDQLSKELADAEVETSLWKEAYKQQEQEYQKAELQKEQQDARAQVIARDLEWSRQLADHLQALLHEKEKQLQDELVDADMSNQMISAQEEELAQLYNILEAQQNEITNLNRALEQLMQQQDSRNPSYDDELMKLRNEVNQLKETLAMQSSYLETMPNIGVITQPLGIQSKVPVEAAQTLTTRAVLDSRHGPVISAVPSAAIPTATTGIMYNPPQEVTKPVYSTNAATQAGKPMEIQQALGHPQRQIGDTDFTGLDYVDEPDQEDNLNMPASILKHPYHEQAQRIMRPVPPSAPVAATSTIPLADPQTVLSRLHSSAPLLQAPHTQHTRIEEPIPLNSSVFKPLNHTGTKYTGRLKTLEVPRYSRDVQDRLYKPVPLVPNGTEPKQNQMPTHADMQSQDPYIHTTSGTTTAPLQHLPYTDFTFQRQPTAYVPDSGYITKPVSSLATMSDFNTQYGIPNIRSSQISNAGPDAIPASFPIEKYYVTSAGTHTPAPVQQQYIKPVDTQTSLHQPSNTVFYGAQPSAPIHSHMFMNTEEIPAVNFAHAEHRYHPTTTIPSVPYSRQNLNYRNIHPAGGDHLHTTPGSPVASSSPVRYTSPVHDCSRGKTSTLSPIRPTYTEFPLRGSLKKTDLIDDNCLFCNIPDHHSLEDYIEELHEKLRSLKAKQNNRKFEKNSRTTEEEHRLVHRLQNELEERRAELEGLDLAIERQKRNLKKMKFEEKRLENERDAAQEELQHLRTSNGRKMRSIFRRVREEGDSTSDSSQNEEIAEIHQKYLKDEIACLERTILKRQTELQDVERTLKDSSVDLRDTRLQAQDTMKKYDAAAVGLQNVSREAVEMEKRANEAGVQLLKTNEHLKTVQGECIELEKKKHRLEKILKDINQVIAKKDAEFKVLNNKVKSTSQNLMQVQEQLSMIGEREREAAQMLKDTEEMLTERKAEIEQLQGQGNYQRLDLEKMDHHVARKRTDLQLLEETIERKQAELTSMFKDAETEVSCKQKELKECQEELRHLESENIEVGNLVKSKIAELQQLKNKIANENEMLQNLTVSIGNQKTEIKHLSELQKLEQTALDNMKMQHVQKLTELDQSQRLLHEVNLELDQLTTDTKCRKREMDFLQQSFEREQQNLNELRLERNSLDDKISRLSKEQDLLGNNCKTLDNNINEMKREQSGMEEKMREKRKQLEGVEVRLQQKETNLESMEAQKTALEEDLQKVKQSVKEHHHELKSLHDTIQEAESQISCLKQDLQQMYLQKDEARHELESLNDAIRQSQQTQQEYRQQENLKHQELETLLRSVDEKKIEYKDAKKLFDSVNLKLENLRFELSCKQQQLQEIMAHSQSLKEESQTMKMDRNKHEATEELKLLLEQKESLECHLQQLRNSMSEIRNEVSKNKENVMVSRYQNPQNQEWKREALKEKLIQEQDHLKYQLRQQMYRHAEVIENARQESEGNLEGLRQKLVVLQQVLLPNDLDKFKLLKQPNPGAVIDEASAFTNTYHSYSMQRHRSKIKPADEETDAQPR